MAEYLRRKEGKKNGDIKRKDFYNYYKENHKYKKLTGAKYNAFLTEFCEEIAKAIVTDNTEFKIPIVGKLRIKASPRRILKKNGEFCKFRADWKATWDNWRNLYPNLTDDEIVALENKKVVYHENEHSNGEFYKFYWDTARNKYSSCYYYKFTPSRGLARLLAKTVLDPNRSVFYFA